MRKMTLEVIVQDDGKLSITTDSQTLMQFLAPSIKKKVQSTYSKEFKAQALRRVINRSRHETIPEVAALLGMPHGTLTDWLHNLTREEHDSYIGQYRMAVV